MLLDILLMILYYKLVFSYNIKQYKKYIQRFNQVAYMRPQLPPTKVT